ncbi:MAG: hypothetical protein GTO76_13730, partial [Planctomycetales bacterium]|nr:hypothetical protein [Planctomycetales bacterium]NIO47701.1 hypothetical protein [Planctomycetales bacterium]NIP05839.1 hypothetical protein [Planctomycetales bacterium]
MARAAAWPARTSPSYPFGAQAGQRAERGFGLMDYRARYYDPRLGRFISADTVVPEPRDPLSLYYTSVSFKMCEGVEQMKGNHVFLHALCNTIND